MSLDFPKRSARKILERIIPPPSGGRDKLHPDLSGLVLPRRCAPGIIRPASFSALCFWSLGLIFSESHYIFDGVENEFAL